VIANMEGEVALPRKNGELVFEAPWQGRAFGMAVVLNEAGQYAWNEFRDHLIAEIQDAPEHADPAVYYERWLASLERLIVEKGLVRPEELEARTEEIASGAREDVF
jgi:nitrile hydratase accessory protein